MRLSRPAHLTPEMASLVTLGRAPRECGAARAEWSLERCPTASLAVFARLGQEPFGTCSRLADLRGATELQLIAYRPSLFLLFGFMRLFSAAAGKRAAA